MRQHRRHAKHLKMATDSTARTAWTETPTSVSLTLVRYIFSHYFYSGLGVACGVLGVALVTFGTFDLPTAVAASTGALAVSIADVPRAAYLKRQQLAAALVLTTITTLVILLSDRSYELQGCMILVISFSAAMLTAYGKESLPVSMAVLIMMAIALGTPAPDVRQIMQHTGIFAVGGVAYLGYALALAVLLRFRTKQQALAECLYEFARYLKLKANFYETDVDLDATYRIVIGQQAIMNERLQSARDLAFRDLNSPRDGQLANTLIAMLDVHEHILAAQTDYECLRERFAGSDVLMFLRDLALKSAQGLEQISFAILRNREPRSAVNYQAELLAIRYELDRHASAAIPADTRAIAVLSEIYETVRQSIARIERLHTVARTPVEPRDVLGGADLQRFTSKVSLSPRPLLDQLRLGSPIFRYALRTMLAMGCGYLLSNILPYAAHSQWILLTLAVIMRPNFSLTKQRRTDRVVGNAIGCALTAGLLHFSPGPGVLFAASFVSLAVAHTFAPIKYRYTAAAACVMALLQLHLLNPEDHFAIGERLIDTAVGALLAYGFSFVLPHWEYRDLPKLAASMLDAAMRYASATLVLPAQDLNYRLARKRFTDAIGLLSVAFGRMLQEPKSRHFIKVELTAFITANYLLAAHLAAVKVLLQRRAKEIDPTHAGPLMDATRASVRADLARAIEVLTGQAETAKDVAGPHHPQERPGTPSGDWNAEVSLDHRLQSIAADARKIRALSNAIATP
jgi:uncharacterized membrane protein YccC